MKKENLERARLVVGRINTLERITSQLDSGCKIGVYLDGGGSAVSIGAESTELIRAMARHAAETETKALSTELEAL